MKVVGGIKIKIGASEGPFKNVDTEIEQPSVLE